MLSIKNLMTRLVRIDSLDIPEGEAVAILGSSGAGKSVLLRAIADLDPNDGEVALDGTDRRDITAPDWRKKVAYLPAESGWWAETVGEHFSDPAAAETILRRLGFKADVFSWAVARLSTGEKQRLSLARTVASAPPVLLLDEPTAALDQEFTSSVEDIIAERLKDGCHVIMVTHDRKQAERICRRRLEIRDHTLHPLEQIS